MNKSTATQSLNVSSLLPTLTLLAGLLGLFCSQTASADVASCKARCEAEKAECLVAANDVRESELIRRKLDGIGPGEMKDLFPDIASLPPKKQENVLMIAELAGRYKDRVNGCGMTYRNCTNMECAVSLR